MEREKKVDDDCDDVEGQTTEDAIATVAIAEKFPGLDKAAHEVGETCGRKRPVMDEKVKQQTDFETLVKECGRIAKLQPGQEGYDSYVHYDELEGVDRFVVYKEERKSNCWLCLRDAPIRATNHATLEPFIFSIAEFTEV